MQQHIFRIVMTCMLALAAITPSILSGATPRKATRKAGSTAAVTWRTFEKKLDKIPYFPTYTTADVQQALKWAETFYPTARTLAKKSFPAAEGVSLLKKYQEKFSTTVCDNHSQNTMDMNYGAKISEAYAAFVEYYAMSTILNRLSAEPAKFHAALEFFTETLNLQQAYMYFFVDYDTAMNGGGSYQVMSNITNTETLDKLAADMLTKVDAALASPSVGSCNNYPEDFIEQVKASYSFNNLDPELCEFTSYNRSTYNNSLTILSTAFNKFNSARLKFGNEANISPALCRSTAEMLNEFTIQLSSGGDV